MIDFNTEFLLHLIVVDDAIAERLDIHDNRAYLRAFIVKNRNTGEVRALVRFHQPTGKSWTELRHQDLDYLREGVVETFTIATHILAPDIENPVRCFTPPADLSPDDTIAWLLDQDLIEISHIAEPGKPPNTEGADGAL